MVSEIFLFNSQDLSRFVVDVLEKKRLHLLDTALTLRLAVGIVQIDPDLSNVLAVPIQPQDLVTVLPNSSRHSTELCRVVVVDRLHPLLHVGEIGVHVRLHFVDERLVDVVDYSSVPLVISSFYFDEAIVVSTLHDGIVHRKRLVEEDVVHVLRDGVFSQSQRLLHSFEVVRIGDELLQTLLSEFDGDVVVDGAMVVVHISSIIHNKERIAFLFSGLNRGFTIHIFSMLIFPFSSFENFQTNWTLLRVHTFASL